MKQYVIFFVVALAVGAGINGLLMSTPTYSVKAGVLSTSLSPQPAGIKRGDTLMPETKMVGAYRKVYCMHQVADTDPAVQTDFPVQSYQY
jgi:hypothetical protein